MKIRVRVQTKEYSSLRSDKSFYQQDMPCSVANNGGAASGVSGSTSGNGDA